MPAPTAGELAAATASYTGGSPFAQGILNADYQGNMLAPHGEVPRWWKGFQVDDDTLTGPGGAVVRRGMLHIEQTLDAACKVYVEQTERDVWDVDFGLMLKGQTQIACNPLHMELARGDRIVLPSRLMVGRVAFTPVVGGNELERFYVSAIRQVVAGGAVLAANTYALTTTSTGMGKITFTTAPAGVALVEFHYSPSYTVLNIADRNPPRGADGVRLLQRTVLTLEQKLGDPT